MRGRTTITSGDFVRTKAGAFGTVLLLDQQDDGSVIAWVERYDDDLELMPIRDDATTGL
jgi:hypothetical protein